MAVSPLDELKLVVVSVVLRWKLLSVILTATCGGTSMLGWAQSKDESASLEAVRLSRRR